MGGVGRNANFHEVCADRRRLAWILRFDGRIDDLLNFEGLTAGRTLVGIALDRKVCIVYPADGSTPHAELPVLDPAHLLRPRDGEEREPRLLNE